MKWLKSPWVLTVLLAIVIVAGSNWYIDEIMQEDTVPEDLMKSRLETMYQGTVQHMTEGLDGYEAEILRNGALYSATVDHKTGKVKAMELLKEAEPEIAVAPKEKPVEEKPEPETDKPAADPKTNPKPETNPETKPAPTPVKPIEKPQAQPKPTPKPAPAPQPEKKKSVVLTGQQAVNIALTQLNANVPVEVDDVDYVETQQGGYYLVELELDTEADLDEVVYQIHAISGKVLSVSWDD